MHIGAERLRSCDLNNGFTPELPRRCTNSSPPVPCRQTLPFYHLPTAHEMLTLQGRISEGPPTLFTRPPQLHTRTSTNKYTLSIPDLQPMPNTVPHQCIHPSLFHVVTAAILIPSSHSPALHPRLHPYPLHLEPLIAVLNTSYHRPDSAHPLPFTGIFDLNKAMPVVSFSASQLSLPRMLSSKWLSTTRHSSMRLIT